MLHKILKCRVPPTARGADKCVQLKLSAAHDRSSVLAELPSPVCPTVLPAAASAHAGERVKLAVQTMFHNVGARLREWLEYYEALGVQRFFLYNHNSTDAHATVLRPFVERGVVVLVDWPFEPAPGDYSRMVQTIALNHCISNYGHMAEWLGMVDVDEYVQVRNSAQRLAPLLDALLSEATVSPNDTRPFIGVQCLEWPFGNEFFEGDGNREAFVQGAMVGHGKERLATRQYVWAALQASPPGRRSKLWIKPAACRAIQSVHELTWERAVVADAARLRLVHYMPQRWWPFGPNPRRGAKASGAQLRVLDESMRKGG